MKSVTPAYEHVLSTVSAQMESSGEVLAKLRRGKRLYPRLSLFPGGLAIVSVAADLGVWAIVLSIAAASALLIGALSYTLVERRLVAGIRQAVDSLDALSEAERSRLLDAWIGDKDPS